MLPTAERHGIYEGLVAPQYNIPSLLHVYRDSRALALGFYNKIGFARLGGGQAPIYFNYTFDILQVENVSTFPMLFD